MERICTTIEQSKKLIELGIDVKTADMDYVPYVNDMTEYNCTINIWNNEHEENWIPCWSLSALLGLMPKVESVGYEQYPILEHDDEGYSMSSPIYNTDYYANPVDAAFEMVCWLKENNKI